MNRVALLPAADRAALFGETGAGRGVANTIIEKDFWVCWTLKQLFGMHRKDAVALVFKGGTSLSKAYGAIRRFSEDIDLCLNRADLGYSGVRDPARDGISRRKADQLIEAAQRTFWEKATALHAEAHRPTGSATPPYFSRHSFDLVALLDTAEGKAAAIDFGLLATVATHKATFFRSTWAQYETARPGTLRLTPSEARIDELRADYRAMSPMMFDEPPIAFDDILERLQRLQNTING